jgi:MarR family transcriptional regulator, organic hydroperoxide resistance regulator
MARIAQDIKQGKPFAHLEEEAYVSLLRTADLHAQAVAEVLKPHGLSPTQYNVLRILRGAGAGGLPCGEIAERMIAKDPDVTRLIDRLAKQGLVERRRSEADRRVVQVVITERGRKAIAPLDEAIAEHHKHRLGHLERADLVKLLALLEAARGSGKDQS